MNYFSPILNLFCPTMDYFSPILDILSPVLNLFSSNIIYFLDNSTNNEVQSQIKINTRKKIRMNGGYIEKKQGKKQNT